MFFNKFRIKSLQLYTDANAINEFFYSTVKEIVKTGVGIWELQYWTQVRWLISWQVPWRALLEKFIETARIYAQTNGNNFVNTQ